MITSYYLWQDEIHLEDVGPYILSGIFSEILNRIVFNFKNINSNLDCMFKVNNRNPRTRCEISPKLTIKTPERRHWHRFGVFIVNIEHISHLVLLFLLLTLSM